MGKGSNFLDLSVNTKSQSVTFCQQMAGLVTDYMEDQGTKFLWKTTPVSIDKTDGGQLKVISQDDQGQQETEMYDTVLMAVGKQTVTDIFCLRPTRLI